MSDAEATTWLDASTVIERLGSKVGGDVDADTLQLHADAVRAYVQPRRPDLVGEDLAGELVFTPTADVVLGASLLAYRLYQRRTLDPTVKVADDVEVRRLLGLGGGFVFGAGPSRAAS